MGLLTPHVQNRPGLETFFHELQGLFEGRGMDPVFRVAELHGMSGHHLFDFLQVLPDFFEHGLLGGQTDFVVRFPLAEISGKRLFADDVLVRLGGLKDHGQVEGVGDD